MMTEPDSVLPHHTGGSLITQALKCDSSKALFVQAGGMSTLLLNKFSPTVKRRCKPGKLPNTSGSILSAHACEA